MDDTLLIDELEREPRTPLDEAVEATLRGLGCVTTNHGLGNIRQLRYAMLISGMPILA
jgi:hypothetical protein